MKKYLLLLALATQAASAQNFACLYIVAVGDSKTLGLTCCAATGGYQSELTNQLLYTSRVGGMFLGVNATGGITIATTKAGIDAWLATQGATPAPTLAIVNLGTNDLASMPSEAQQESDLAYILDAIRTKWAACAVLVVKPWYPTQSANAAILATRIDHVVSTRAWSSASVDESTFLSGLLEGDGIHPTIVGYRATATAIRTAIGF